MYKFKLLHTRLTGTLPYELSCEYCLKSFSAQKVGHYNKCCNCHKLTKNFVKLELNYVVEWEWNRGLGGNKYKCKEHAGPHYLTYYGAMCETCVDTYMTYLKFKLGLA